MTLEHQTRIMDLVILVDLATLHPRIQHKKHKSILDFREGEFEIFLQYGHGGHFILEIFPSPDPKRLHMRFDKNCPCGFMGEAIRKW